MRKCCISILIALLIFNGCIRIPKHEGETLTSYVFNKDFSSVWNAVTKTAFKNNYHLKLIEKDSGIQVFDSTFLNEKDMQVLASGKPTISTGIFFLIIIENKGGTAQYNLLVQEENKTQTRVIIKLDMLMNQLITSFGFSKNQVNTPLESCGFSEALFLYETAQFLGDLKAIAYIHDFIEANYQPNLTRLDMILS